jgi:hypothetical protein
MRRVLRSVLAGIVITMSTTAPAWAQGGSTRTALSGTVLDTAGGVVPGATVDVKHARTGVVTSVVTNDSGVFDVPALDAGVYVVTVSLSGFRSVVKTDVELLSGVPRALRVELEVGGVQEAVEVRGGSQLVQTQTTTVSATIRADQIEALPLVTRNTLNFAVFLPGVDTSANNHNQRQSTIVGLPQSAISVTVDGANVQDKYGRSTDGFFANVQPRLDAIEEVTMTSATASADASGQGAVQIRFVTRSGTNSFVGSAYEYLRHDRFNSNNYFNAQAGLPKNLIELNQWGVREGGPIVIPGRFDGRNKAFFFVNFEQLRYPLNNSRTRGVLTPAAQQGLFRYAVAGAPREVNLFALAARNGQTATPDPTIAALLTKIRGGTQTTGTFRDRTDPNVQDYSWQPESLRIDNVPTVRLDFNLTTSQRLTTSYQYQGQRLTPNLFGNDEPNFPGLVNQAELYSAISRGSTTLRSTLGSAKVNELRVGYSNGPVWFADTVTSAQFEDQSGFDILFPNVGSALTNATTNRGPTSRNGKGWNIDDTFSWLRGNHSIQFGGSFSRIAGWTTAQNVVPQLTLGVDAADPANAMFTTENFPGAANADLANARAMYALLTGRITQIASEVRLDPSGRYVYMGLGGTEERQDEIGLYVQDSWRLRPSLTLNAGVRWQVALPFRPTLSVYSANTFADLCGVSGLGDGPEGRECNLFNPGVFNAGGVVPTYLLYEAGEPGYHTEYDNFAPNVGVAWQPNAQSGFLRTLLGDPELATIRGSFGIAYNSDGLGVYTGVYGLNPGSVVNTSRSATSTQYPLVPPGQSWPVLLRDTARTGPAPNIPTAPQYPMAVNFNNGVNLFHPDYKTPFAKSYSLGVQRSIGRLTAFEVRYVGTRLVDGAATENWNEINYTTNGFLNEFRLAQANLQSHIAAGCGQSGNAACSFAYRGPGTNPLPIYLGAFTGNTAANAADPARYTGTNWTNTTRLGELAARNPNPTASATALFTDATFRANMATAGFPVNFFVLNPHVNQASVRTNGATTQYDSMQFMMRRALSDGLAVDVNYTYARRLTSTLDTLRRPRRNLTSTDAVPHAVKFTTFYELPFGRDKRFASNVDRWVDAAIGGWSLNVTGRVQSGSILDFGNVRVVGMSQDDLRDAFKIRIDDATGTVYTLPQDIIDNTIKAYSTSATSATGYGALGPPTGRYLAPPNGPDCIQEVRGDCAPANVFVTGPIFTRFDLTARKRFLLGGRRSFDLSADIFNLFNAINFLAVAQTGSGATINQVTQSYQDPNVTFDPGGRLVQLVFRLNF